MLNLVVLLSLKGLLRRGQAARASIKISISIWISGLRAQKCRSLWTLSARVVCTLVNSSSLRRIKLISGNGAS